ncbi:MAG TPA: hypothetical protein VN750_22640 [Steroidobacteraceae bacterium]|nr:hypothetical protein [Steroidobacteraceae bacterium]
MKSTAVAGLLIAAILSSSSGGSPADSASADHSPAAHGKSAAYLGKEADLIGAIALRPAAAIVLLSEPCGARQGYGRARLFRYGPIKSAPTAEQDGCYRKQDRRAGARARIIVYESDGTSLGKPFLEVPGAEPFAPRYFFRPLAEGTGNSGARIVAVGESSREAGADYAALGLTRQACPFAKGWLLAQQLAEGSSEGDRRCWEERGDSIAVRAIEYPKNAPPRLSAEEKLVNKSGFFAAATLATTPVKYDWSSR